MITGIGNIIGIIKHAIVALGVGILGWLIWQTSRKKQADANVKQTDKQAEAQAAHDAAVIDTQDQMAQAEAEKPVSDDALMARLDAGTM